MGATVSADIQRGFVPVVQTRLPHVNLDFIGITKGDAAIYIYMHICVNRDRCINHDAEYTSLITLNLLDEWISKGGVYVFSSEPDPISA